MTQAPILVGTDLSNSSEQAIQQAGAWARRTGAPLVVCHIAPDEVFRALETPKVAAALRARTESLLGPSAPALEVVIGSGSPHAALVHLADERGATLLVVGASSRESFDRVLFGSTAEQVVRYAHCPVLVARKSPADGIVLAATDFSDPATTAVAAAAEEANRRAVPLRLVHSLYEPSTSLSLLGPMVISLPEIPAAERDELKSAAEATLRSLLAATHASGACEVVLGAPASAIPAEAKSLGAGLVVVASRGRTGLARIALGSVAEAIARNAPCSVLAVRKSAGQPK